MRAAHKASRFRIHQGKVKFADAFRTLTWPTGSVRLTVVVELENVPVDGALFTVVAAANWGINFTVKTVPTGVLVAVRVTVTGLVVPCGKETSAVV